jgi:hypothetical protein
MVAGGIAVFIYKGEDTYFHGLMHIISLLITYRVEFFHGRALVLQKLFRNEYAQED